MRMHRKKWRVVMVYGTAIVYEELNSVKIAREMYDNDRHARALYMWRSDINRYKIVMAKP